MHHNSWELKKRFLMEKDSNYITLLNNEIEQKIKIYSGEIERLYSGFTEINQMPNPQFAYEIVFGFLTSEYVYKLQIPSISNHIDEILLCARRLLEVFITIKYISQTKTFSNVLEYCMRDKYEYLDGCNARSVADAKFFPELKDLYDYALRNKQEKEAILKRYNGKKPKKMPDMLKMAKEIGYEEEYSYFYKFTSKILHFCPFSLNGDVNLNIPIHKVVFLNRIAKYLEEIYKELENIYQSIPKVN